jgi:hypothetical protein
MSISASQTARSSSTALASHPDPPRLRPLSERILASLPGRRWAWIVAWALVPWLNAGANLLLDTGERSAIWEQSRTYVIHNYAALSLAVVITVWGAQRIARRLEAIRLETSKVLSADVREPFREMSSEAGPLLLSAGAAVAFGISALVRDGWTPGILRGATWLVLGVAFWTFLWTYGSLQLGLHRLGRERLATDAARLDPGLGLEPLGRVAFTGLWLLLAAFVPVVLTRLRLWTRPRRLGVLARVERLLDHDEIRIRPDRARSGTCVLPASPEVRGRIRVQAS